MIDKLYSKILTDKEMINHKKDNNDFLYYIVQNILDNIEYDVGIEKDSLKAIYDYQILETSEANWILENHMEFIVKHRDCLENQTIDFANIEKTLTKFVENYNCKLIDSLKFNKDVINLFYFDKFVEHQNKNGKLSDFLDNQNISHFEFEQYLFDIYCFYRSLLIFVEDNFVI